MNVLKNLKIRDKLIACFAINIAFIVTIGIVSYFSIKKINANLDDIFLQRLPSMNYLLEADRDLHQALIAERTLLSAGENSALKNDLTSSFKENSKQTFDRYRKYESLVSGEEERLLIPQFKKAYQEWYDEAMEIVSLANEGDPDSIEIAVTLSMGSSSERFEFMRNFIDKGTELNLNDAKIAHENAIKVFKSTIAFLVGAVIVATMIAVGLALLVSYSITHPVHLTTLGLKEVAEGKGDLTKRLEILSKDEVGELTKWFNAFVENMQSLIKTISRNSDSTLAAAKKLTDLAEQTSGNATNLSEKSQSVSAASEEMSVSITTVAASVEEYSSNINVVASASEEMNASVMEIAKSSTRANEMTSESVQQANITSEKMRSLEEAAQEITKVTEVINAISDQTNLLALNATIEAASAGEAGKGFAVVANEIKELAKQTSNATNEIQTQIDNIQGSSKITIDQITRITEIIGDVDGVVTTIASAVEEQSVTTREISGNISQASASIGEVSRNVAQGSDASNSVAKEISEVDSLVASVSEMSVSLKDNAVELNDSSTELNRLVSRFKV